MADSNITKSALATALRALMQEMPFDKIQVTHICERCGLNRKSFYYHFKDKYDLVNWIFDTEFMAIAMEFLDEITADDRWDLIERACEYFYENRAFYRKALQIRGQNSFSDHLREFCFPLMKIRVAQLIGSEAAEDFTVDFFTDAMICAIERWLLDKACMPPTQFVSKVKRIIQGGAAAIYQEMNPD